MPPLQDDEVRISFYHVRNTDELDQTWGVVFGRPDVVYASVGTWTLGGGGKSPLVCNPDVLRIIASSVPRVVWATVQRRDVSQCDRKMMMMTSMMTSSRGEKEEEDEEREGGGEVVLENVQILDRTLIPNTPLGEVTRMERKNSDSVNYAQIVSIMDAMRLVKLLDLVPPEENERSRRRRSVEFSPSCVAVGSRRELAKQGIQVVPPNQGWKTPWKLPCRLVIT